MSGSESDLLLTPDKPQSTRLGSSISSTLLYKCSLSAPTSGGGQPSWQSILLTAAPSRQLLLLGSQHFWQRTLSSDCSLAATVLPQSTNLERRQTLFAGIPLDSFRKLP
ncbi:hypothetical protein F4819DRAFT_136363 [Hypoxylon fuscum]|nr:hypothetical protein F4819DRAFT_136363 [Hypoxylon fuscum]